MASEGQRERGTDMLMSWQQLGPAETDRETSTPGELTLIGKLEARVRHDGEAALGVGRLAHGRGLVPRRVGALVVLGRHDDGAAARAELDGHARARVDAHGGPVRALA